MLAAVCQGCQDQEERRYDPPSGTGPRNPRGLFIDTSGTVYVADSRNHRVMRWYKGAQKGTIIAGGNGRGKQANQFDDPWDLSFDYYGNLYVTDPDNHRVQKFSIE